MGRGPRGYTPARATARFVVFVHGGGGVGEICIPSKYVDGCAHNLHATVSALVARTRVHTPYIALYVMFQRPRTVAVLDVRVRNRLEKKKKGENVKCGVTHSTAGPKVQQLCTQDV